MTARGSRSVARVLAIALGVFAGSAPVAAQPVSEQDVLTVQGSGIVELAPDVADVLIGVRTEEPTAAGALDTNSLATGRVVADAKRLGIPDRDIQTSLLQLSGTEREEKGRRVKVHQAANTVTVRVRDLPKLGAIVRELVDAGANQIQGIRFSLANPQPHFDQARRQAVEDARRRATILADAAGRRLGPVVTIAETTWNDPGVVTMARAVAPRGDVPVEAGQIGVRAGVAVKWRLEP